MPPTPDPALENRFPLLPPPSIIFQFTNMSCLVWNMPAAGQAGQKCKSNFIICHGQFFWRKKRQIIIIQIVHSTDRLSQGSKLADNEGQTLSNQC